jgi:hypothetical protein
LRPQVTIPIAFATLIIGIFIVQVDDGPAATLQTAPPGPRLVISTTTEPQPPTCTHIVELGDSNLAMAAQRFRAAYAAIGVDATIDTALGRGATTAKDGTTGLEAIASAQGKVPSIGRCWILELSAEDAVNSLVRHTDPAVSIAAMADAIGDEPTVWITPVLTSTTTDWKLSASTAYNVVLAKVSQARPNITLLDWQDIALQHLDEFQPDGVHYTNALYDTFVQTVIEKVTQVWALRP